MKCFKPTFFLLLVLFISPVILAQENNDNQATLDNGTVDEQFEYILRKSGNFRGTTGEMYEAVKLSMITTLQSHIKDTLVTLRKDLANTQATVKSQAQEINDLKANLSNTQVTLDTTTKEKDSMSLFGMQMSKSGYNILMWTIIGALIAMLSFFIFKFKSSNTITRQAKKALAEIEDEFDEHRRVSLEREQKVRRQLQDEINKQKSDS